MNNEPLTMQATTSTAPSIPINVPQFGADWALILAGLAWAGRQVWEMFTKKEDREASLTDSLIQNLLQNNQALLAGNRDGFEKMVDAVRELKDTIHSDVQGTMKAQTAMYASNQQALSEIKSALDALHRRLDDHLKRDD